MHCNPWAFIAIQSNSIDDINRAAVCRKQLPVKHFTKSSISLLVNYMLLYFIECDYSGI